MKTALIVALAGMASVATAQIGDPVIAGGGDVTVTILPSDAGYTSDLYFLSNMGPIYIGSNRDNGTQLDLGVFNAGEELVFKLFVRDTENTFYTGDAARNPDGIFHARVDQYPGYSVVGFEDLFNGGDHDYNDCQFSFTNVVPSPGVASIALAGLPIVARRRRR